MHPYVKDITGERFTRLLVVEYLGEGRWKCSCQCGKTISVQGTKLRNGHTKSCGCFRRDNPGGVTHGKSNGKLYGIWSGIKRRCYNPNDRNFPRYGARGIVIEDQNWIDDYSTFHDWAMLNGYKQGLQIDRIDNLKGYSPNNCRFVTKSENCNNKRNNHLLTIFDETKTMMDWTRDSRCIVGYSALKQRIKSGWDHVLAITSQLDSTTPANQRQHYNVFKAYPQYKEWANQ